MKGLLKKLGLVQDPKCNNALQLQDALYKSQAVIEYDIDGTVIAVNDCALHMTGHRECELVGRKIVDLGGNSNHARHVWRQIVAGQVTSNQWQRSSAKGPQKVFSASYFSLVDPDGSTYKILEIIRDITQENMQRDVCEAINQSSSCFMLLDSAFHVVSASLAMTRLFELHADVFKNSSTDFSPETILGQHITSLLPDMSEHLGAYPTLTSELRSHLCIKDKTFSILASPWKNAQGDKVGTMLQWEDKTDALLAETERQRRLAQGEQARLALLSSGAAVMFVSEDGYVTSLTPALLSLLETYESRIRDVDSHFSVAGIVGGLVQQLPLELSGIFDMLSRVQQRQVSVSGLTFQLNSNPLPATNGLCGSTCVEWIDLTQSIAQVAKTTSQDGVIAKLQHTIDSISSRVMWVDNEENIGSANPALIAMFVDAEHEYRRCKPNLKLNNLVGVPFADMHVDIQYQKGFLYDLSAAYEGTSAIGERTFSIVATPLTIGSKRYGTIVEWRDRTEEVAFERQVEQMLSSASLGDFSQHMNTLGQSGLFLVVGKGLNHLVASVETVVSDMVRMLGAMSKGDLSERITRDYVGAFGQLKNDANATAERLTDVIAHVRESSRTISESANEIAQGNADLHLRTEQQASSLEQTSSSMEQMTSTVTQSVDNVQRASAMACNAQTLAREGGGVVESAVAAMNQISDSSKKISDIIGVIDEIAFQTNLLALNAAVEAARAGEQGRGFAVVAGEVRNLAQRSASAAKEIKDLIRDSVTKVEGGAQLVNKSGATLAGIVESVDQVNDMMQEIASAAREQSSGIAQVNTAILQMDEMTQQNAALVEEASAAGASMSEQAEAMNKLVDFFSRCDVQEHYLSCNDRNKSVAIAATHALSTERPPEPVSTNRAKPSVPIDNNLCKPTIEPMSEVPNYENSFSNSDVESDDEWEEF